MAFGAAEDGRLLVCAHACRCVPRALLPLTPQWVELDRPAWGQRGGHLPAS